MNKGIIIGIAVIIIIAAGVLVVSTNYSGVNEEILPIETPKDEPKRFSVGLEESVGFSESP